MDLVLAHMKPLASKGEKNQLRWYRQQQGGFHVGRFGIHFYHLLSFFLLQLFFYKRIQLSCCWRSPRHVRTVQERYLHPTPNLPAPREPKPMGTFGYPIPREPGTRNRPRPPRLGHPETLLGRDPIKDSLCMLMKVHLPSRQLLGAYDVIPGPEPSNKLKFNHSP